MTSPHTNALATVIAIAIAIMILDVGFKITTALIRATEHNRTP